LLLPVHPLDVLLELRILDAPSSAAVELDAFEVTVLGSQKDAVLKDGRDALRTVTEPEFRDYREATEEAADAHKAGLYRNAQALASH
jgi:hypothetical protein